MEVSGFQLSLKVIENPIDYIPFPRNNTPQPYRAKGAVFLVIHYFLNYCNSDLKERFLMIFRGGHCSKAIFKYEIWKFMRVLFRRSYYLEEIGIS